MNIIIQLMLVCCESNLLLAMVNYFKFPFLFHESSLFSNHIVYCFRSKIMEGRSEGGGTVKPTGANKRKGANPVRQIVNEGGGGSSGVPLDLSVNHDVSRSKKVILSVPQYKLVSSSSSSSLVTTSETSLVSPKLEPELSIVPITKQECSSDPEVEWKWYFWETDEYYEL